MPNWKDSAKAYPLSIDEQRLLFRELPTHLAEMALFAVHTGARESVISQLRWSWEVKVPELRTSVFLVPGEFTKNGTNCLLVLNSVAKRVIESRRGLQETHVFGYRGSLRSFAVQSSTHHDGITQKSRMNF